MMSETTVNTALYLFAGTIIALFFSSKLRRNMPITKRSLRKKMRLLLHCNYEINYCNYW